jgi:hypothetical protein
MATRDNSYQYLLKDRRGISEDAVGRRYTCVEACTRRPWLQFFREWYLVPYVSSTLLLSHLVRSTGSMASLFELTVRRGPDLDSLT